MNRARAMLAALEPYYTVLSEHERKDLLQQAGLKGGWMTYFATRAAPMGAVPAEIVIAAFLVFAPSMVRRAVPDAWELATVDVILDRRLAVVDAALRRLLGDGMESEALREAAELARRATEACDPGGRPVFAANARLPWPDAPHLVLWHAANLIREHRGDGHMACLVAAGLDGCEAIVTHAAAVPEESYYQRNFRGWSAQEWTDAERRLRDRGWLDASGGLTASGSAARAEIERQTDAYAADPWEHLGEDLTGRLGELMRPIVTALRARGDGGAG